MPSPVIALDVIRIAMQHIGVLAEGETPTADQASDGLRALNDVLETWSIESLSVWGGLPETFSTVAGQASYSIGPGGDWDTARPVTIGSIYTTVSGNDFAASPWTLDEYAAAGVKAQLQPNPDRYVFINDAPLARVLLFPTPSEAVPITVDTPRILAQVAAIGSALILPPGYARAMQYAVAVELQPRYGSPIDVSAQARSMMAKIKRANRTPRISSFDSALLGGVRGGGGGGGGYVGPAPAEWSEIEW